jgi:hypothetical protein
VVDEFGGQGEVFARPALVEAVGGRERHGEIVVHQGVADYASLHWQADALWTTWGFWPPIGCGMLTAMG